MSAILHLRLYFLGKGSALTGYKLRAVQRLDCGFLLLHDGGNVAWAGMDGAKLWLLGESAYEIIRRGKAFTCN